MKETILRSPNIVIMCEWSGYSINSKDAKKKIQDLINWFASLKFRFYRLGSRSEKCAPQGFNEMTPEYLISMPDARERGSLFDILIIPGHIDPKKTL